MVNMESTEANSDKNKLRTVVYHDCSHCDSTYSLVHGLRTLRATAVPKRLSLPLCMGQQNEY